MYDYIIFTHLPAFYKVNLYNELSRKLRIFVVFIANDTDEKRAIDFSNKSLIEFEHTILSSGSFQNRDKFSNILKINKILSALNFNKIIVGGWDLVEFWFIAFTVQKQKNYLALESTVMDSKLNGAKGKLKSFFLSRMIGVFASGQLHKNLLDTFGYKGEIKITGGVGIINKPSLFPLYRNYNKRYVYVGRLTEEKNIKQLILIFNRLPRFKLTIIGTGPMETELKKCASINIEFKGQVPNKNIKDHYIGNDFFILPSLREPWGLVVEEALYFGMPVIVSDKCGASELVKNGVNGFVFDPESEKDLKKIIVNQNQLTYLDLLHGVQCFSIDSKDKAQVETYL